MFHLDFWFHLQAVSFTPWIGKTIQIVMSLFILGGIICYVLYLNKTFSKLGRRLLRRVGFFAILAGISGWMFYWFTTQDVPVLSMRFWFLVWFLTTVIWAGYLIRAYLRLHQTQQIADARAGYEKWLPKPKK